jgi:hypothetical protein
LIRAFNEKGGGLVIEIDLPVARLTSGPAAT